MEHASFFKESKISFMSTRLEEHTRVAKVVFHMLELILLVGSLSWLFLCVIELCMQIRSESLNGWFGHAKLCVSHDAVHVL